MTNIALNKWRVYCQDEASYQHWWLEDTQSEPTKCPNNSSHTITPSITKVVDRRKTDVVQIRQESVPTGEHYQWKTESFTALANGITNHTFSYPIPVSVIEAQFISSSENIGDSWSWTISPNTIIGAITANVNIGDVIINVSPTVVNNIAIGFHVNLFNGVSNVDLGEVIAVNKTARTITMHKPSTAAFLASSPTYVRMNIYFMKDAVIGHPWIHTYGEGKILTSYVPANTIVKVSYNNKHPTLDKFIVCNIEVMF